MRRTFNIESQLYFKSRALSLVLAAGLIQNTLPGIAQDDVQLRPPQSTSSELAPSDSRTTLNQSVQPLDSRSSDVTSAHNSINVDFLKHKNSTIMQQTNTPHPVGSGASGSPIKAVLTKSNQVEAGPSQATGNGTPMDEIQLTKPALKSLVSVNDYISPFRFDASSESTINLQQALNLALDQNLDLAISRTNTKQKEFAYYSSLGNFLPDPTFGYSDYITKGHIGLPESLSSFLGGSSTAALSSATTSSATSLAALSTASSASSASSTIKIHHPFEIMHAGLDYHAYRGGSVLFGALQSKHNLKAAKHQESANLSDTLMSITQNYYNLMLAETLLQIRVDATQVSEEQLRRNQDRFHSGLATNLDVLQSKTQLSRDRQALLDQQVNRRSASIALADSLNIDLSGDLVPIEQNVKKVRLIDSRMNISDILQLALDNRPELKQYEELRMAAKRAIMVAAANLQPTVLISGNAYGIGPPSNVQALGVLAINANWRLKGAGTVDAFGIQQARWQARQASLNSQKELQTILSQVRNSYLQILDKEKNIEEASNEVQSSLEELRLAELRKSSGLGINLDIITAQRDYTQARVDKAQAIINFNIAQAQLLHDTGLISVDALTTGRLLSKASR
jgi:outer membrane protein TolC